MSHWKTWLLVAVAALVLDVLPPATHFFFLCVAFGALAAPISSFFASSSALAWIVFVVVTAILCPILMPLARFLFKGRPSPIDPAALSGQRAIVAEPLTTGQSGMVSVAGELWRARAAEGSFQVRDEV